MFKKVHNPLQKCQGTQFSIFCVIFASKTNQHTKGQEWKHKLLGGSKKNQQDNLNKGIGRNVM